MHWEVKPIKAVSSCNDEVLEESTPSDYEIEYVEISGVDSSRGITQTTVIPFGNAPSRARRRVTHGDILVSTVRTYLRAIAPVNNPPINMIASTGFAVIRPRYVEPCFLGFIFQAEYLIAQIIAHSVGVSYPAINASDLMHLNIPIPSREEQQSIAAFLDRETGKIDALIAEQRRLVELLAEKRQAVISHAVTKGLNPNAPMKDSGIEWLGEVPEHWTIRRLVQLTAKIGDGLHGTPQYVDGSEYFFINGNNLINGCISLNETTKCVSREEFETHQVELNEHTLLMSINGTIGNLAFYQGESVILGKSAAYINCLSILSKKLLFYILKSNFIKTFYELEVTGTTIFNLSLETIRNTWIPLPPLDEQCSIVDFLNQEIASLDALTTEANRATALLQERRSALISAAVTGKIDVRKAPLAEAA
jgi:type I restriction enzyme S subunit